jgi:hypothetical protein
MKKYKRDNTKIMRRKRRDPLNKKTSTITKTPNYTYGVIQKYPL